MEARMVPLHQIRNDLLAGVGEDGGEVLPLLRQWCVHEPEQVGGYCRDRDRHVPHGLEMLTDHREQLPPVPFERIRFPVAERVCGQRRD